jgi:hypothetical protein
MRSILVSTGSPAFPAMLRGTTARHARSDGEATRTHSGTNRSLDIRAIEENPLTRPEELGPTIPGPSRRIDDEDPPSQGGSGLSGFPANRDGGVKQPRDNERASICR